MRKAGSTINASSLAGRVSGIKRLLLKTYFSGATCFDTDYPCFTPDAARFLSGNGMLCVGIDSPSVEALHSDGTVHRELLGHGCVIIELLDLENVREGDYIMAALPLRLAGLDGSPARVILIDRKRVP
jgi:arylformamidase